MIAAVARHPQSAAPRRELGRYYVRARRPLSALWELEQALAWEPSDAASRVDLAAALALARHYPEAESELRKVTERLSASRVGRQELAALLLATGRPNEVADVLRAVPNLETWPEGLLLLGRAQEGQGRVAEARRAYEACWKLAPENKEARFRLARLLLAGGALKAARALLEESADAVSLTERTNPGSAKPVVRQVAGQKVLLALTYSARWGDREQPDRQGELLSEALAAGGSVAVTARLALGELYLRHGRVGEAAVQLARASEAADVPAAHRGLAHALDRMGQPAEAAYHRGMAAVGAGHADEALREFETMARLAPDDRRAPQLISQALVQQNDLNAALTAARRLYDRGDRSPDLLERLATLLLLTHDRRLSRRIGEEWLKVQPDSARPLTHLGKVALADLRLKEAVALYEQAVAKEPRQMEPLVGLAEALAHQPSPENLERAVALLRRATALAPEDPRPWYLLGARLQQQGRLEEARAALLRTLDVDPSQPGPYNNLVQVAAALKQPALVQRLGALMRATQERKRELEAAWKARWAHPNDPEVYLTLARRLVARGSLSAAEHQLKRALALRPGWPPAVSLHATVARLLDGIDPDGRRLVVFPD